MRIVIDTAEIACWLFGHRWKFGYSGTACDMKTPVDVYFCARCNEMKTIERPDAGAKRGN